MKIKHLLIVGVATLLGAGSGAALKIVAPMAPGKSNPVGDEHAPDELDKDAAPKLKPIESAKKTKSKSKTAQPSAAYFKFSRQFVAPVVSDGAPEAMIILDVVIELAPGAESTFYADEPKLRDAVLRALLTQSSNGALAAMLQQPALLETTRAAILENIRAVAGDEALSVLLMDVAYQPF